MSRLIKKRKQRAFRVAVVGCGRHARECLVPILRSFHFVEIIGYVDKSIERAQALSHSGEICYKDLDHWTLQSMDAAIVAVPPHDTGPILNQLLGRRIPTFVEKPVASTSVEISAMLAKQGDVPVQVGFNYRYAPRIQSMKTSLATQFNLRHLIIEYKSKYPCGPEWENPDPIGSWLMHNGIHALDLCCWLQDSAPKEISSEISSIGDRYILDVEIQHASGSSTSLHLGNATHDFRLSMKATDHSGQEIKVEPLGKFLKQQCCESDSQGVYSVPVVSKNFVRGHHSCLQSFFEGLDGPLNKALPDLACARDAARLGEMVLKHTSLKKVAALL